MSKVKPTETELKCARAVTLRADREKDCPDYIEAINNNAVEIARYTRYEGQTAEELGKERWNVVAMRNAAIERAEKAEARVKELERACKKLEENIESRCEQHTEQDRLIAKLEAEALSWQKEAAFVGNLYAIANAKVTELEAEIGRTKEEREQDGMEKDLNT